MPVTSAGVGPLCFIKSKVNAAVYQEILEHFMLPSADKLYGKAGFLFQQDLSTCPHLPNPLPSEGSIVLQQCHRLITSILHFTDAGVCDKVALTKN